MAYYAFPASFIFTRARSSTKRAPIVTDISHSAHHVCRLRNSSSSYGIASPYYVDTRCSRILAFFNVYIKFYQYLGVLSFALLSSAFSSSVGSSPGSMSSYPMR
eukprot:PhF_6_TR39064/c0_g1_i1/m.58462